MQKIIKTLIALFTLLAMFSVSAAAEQEDVNKLELMKAIGLFSDSVEAEATVTRGEMVAIMLQCAGYEIGATAEDGTYNDVGLSDTHGDVVYAATKLGIVSGMGDGTFRPSEPIDGDAAMKMLVCAMGYGAKAELQGGYPQGYNRVAAGWGVNGGGKETITYTELAGYIYKLFDKEVAEIQSVTADGDIIFSKSVTLLEQLDLVCVEGVMTANAFTDIMSGGNAGENTIRVNDKAFTVAEDYSDLLGARVRVYAEDSDDLKPQALYVHTYKTEIVTVMCEDIENPANILSSGELKYTNENGKLKSYKLVQNPVMLYNGVNSIVRGDAVFNISTGEIKLIDNDDDGYYDVAAIYESYDVIVESYSAAAKILVDKGGNSVYITSDNCYDAFTVTNKDGVAVDITTLLEWDVASVFFDKPAGYANRRVVRIITTNESVMGTVSAIDDEGNAVIDGTAYRISGNYVSNEKINPITMGNSGVFLMNVFGDICGAKSEMTAELKKKFGILISARYVEDENTGKNVARFKIYDTNYEIIYADAAKKVRVDGTRYDSDECIDHLLGGDGIAPRQIVRYTLNEDGEMSFLDTAYNDPIKEDSSSLKRIRSMTDEALKYREGANSFMNKYAVTKNAMIIGMPTDIDDEAAYTFNEGGFENDKPYSVDIYITDNPFEPDVIAYNADSTSMTNFKDSIIYVVTKITHCLSNEGEPGAILNISGSQAMSEVFIKDEILNNFDLARGDVIAFSLNAKKEVKELKQIYDLSEDEFFSVTNPSADFLALHRVSKGYVYEKYGSRFSLTCDATPTIVANRYDLENRNLDSYTAWVYDTEEQTARKATSADLADFLSSGMNCSKVVVTEAACWPKICIIYN